MVRSPANRVRGSSGALLTSVMWPPSRNIGMLEMVAYNRDWEYTASRLTVDAPTVAAANITFDSGRHHGEESKTHSQGLPHRDAVPDRRRGGAGHPVLQEGVRRHRAHALSRPRRQTDARRDPGRRF